MIDAKGNLYKGYWKAGHPFGDGILIGRDGIIR